MSKRPIATEDENLKAISGLQLKAVPLGDAWSVAGVGS